MAQSVATGDEEGARSDNYAWHFAVYRASHGKYLMGMITQLWVQADWPAIWGVPGQLEKSVIEHDKVSRAIQHGDGKTAGLYMSQHINRGMEMVLDMIDLGDDDG
jgi:DNA-binding FadR family transcriptional regulator